MIIPNFNDFFWYLEVDGVEMTSITSELNFQKALPKHVKRRMIVMGGSERDCQKLEGFKNYEIFQKIELFEK